MKPFLTQHYGNHQFYIFRAGTSHIGRSNSQKERLEKLKELATQEIDKAAICTKGIVYLDSTYQLDESYMLQIYFYCH